jgi:hypothetical protein
MQQYVLEVKADEGYFTKRLNSKEEMIEELQALFDLVGEKMPDLNFNEVGETTIGIREVMFGPLDTVH